MPMVDPAKGDFDGVVVRFDPFNNRDIFTRPFLSSNASHQSGCKDGLDSIVTICHPYAYRLPGSTQRVDPGVNPLQRNIAKKRPPSARQVRATFLFSVPPVRPYPQLSSKRVCA